MTKNLEVVYRNFRLNQERMKKNISDTKNRITHLNLRILLERLLLIRAVQSHSSSSANKITSGRLT